jgi:glycosyltransferase involved in cell wall biosynthesis
VAPIRNCDARDETVKMTPTETTYPSVSIIVTSFNQGRFIRATIDSILSQDYRPLTIHVIDGGSKDETVDVLKSYGNIPELQWLSEPDRGVVDAVNKGFKQVNGEIVAIQSSDDMYLPNAISTIVKEFQNRPEVGLIYGDTVMVDEFGTEINRRVIGPFSLENVFLMKTWIPQPSAFFRRKMLDECGNWDESIPYAPDTDLWIRMAFRTAVVKLDQFLSQRRIHGTQRDTQAAKIFRDYNKMIAQSVDLRNSPPRLQRIARAGGHLIGVRYNPTSSDLRAAYHLLMAGMIYPPCFNPARLFHFATLPLRRLGSRLKQSLLRNTPRDRP